MGRVVMPDEEPLVVYDDSIIVAKIERSTRVNRIRFFLIRKHARVIFFGDKARFYCKHRRKVKVPKRILSRMTDIEEWIKINVEKYDREEI